MDRSVVIFDLGGTLIDNFDAAAYRECVRELAGVLGLGEELVARWMSADTATRTLLGEFSGFHSQLAHCSGTPIASFPVSAVEHAAAIHHGFACRLLTPRADAIPVLTDIRRRGYRIGLLSDCGWDVPELWDTTPFAPLFDAPVFSSTASLKKPDPRFFELVCERLGVSPGECVYVADGNSRELSAAREMGMQAVLICVPYEREAVMQREDPQLWRGPVIESLTDLLALL